MGQQNFNNSKTNLTENDIDQIIEIIGHGCQANTVQLLRRRLELFPSLIPNYGILDRLIKEQGQWAYCAGQSYPDEIRTVRQIIKDMK